MGSSHNQSESAPTAECREPEVDINFRQMLPSEEALEFEVDSHKQVCSYPGGSNFNHSVMLLDGITQKARHTKNPSLDVSKAKSVLIKEAMIVLKEGSPVAAYKYASFEDPAYTVKTLLATLP